MGCRKLTYSDSFSPNLRVLKGGASKPKTEPTWNYQWDLIHDPQSMFFSFLQDESEGQMESQDDIITQICQAVLSNGENGCAFVRRINSSNNNGDGIVFNSNTVEYLAGKYVSDKIEINTIVSVVDVTTLASLIRNTLTEETTSELILYVSANGEIGFCTPQEDYSGYSPLADAADNTGFLEKFKADYLSCKNAGIFDILQGLQAFARSNQHFELSVGGKVYSLDNNTLKEENSSDAEINAGNWTDGSIDMKMRVGYNADGILQFTALGIRNNLTLAAGKSATLNGQNSVALNMLAKNNALLQEYSISDILATPNDVGANLDSEKFPDEKKVEIKKDAAFMKILCEAGGIGLSFLKTAEIEQPVYLASEASTTIKAPPIGTGALEAGAMAVTDITSMVTTIHDLVTDKQARTDAVAGLKAIKDQVVDQPTVLFPILGEVALQELTGTGKDGYKEMLNGTTDEGRKGHLIAKTSVRTTVSVFTSGKFLAKLPDMAIEMATKMPKAKLWLRFRNISDDLAEELLTKFDDLADGGNKFLDDFIDASDGTLEKFLNNPELIDAWKKMDAAGVDEVLRKNTDWLERVSDNAIEVASDGKILKNGDEVGRIVNGNLEMKYSAHGGDIVCDPNKTTTVLGKWEDPAGGGTSEIINSKLSKSGQSTGGVNALSEDIPVGWSDQQIWDNVNEPWLRDAANRGDVIRVVSDPNVSDNIYKLDGSLSFFGREHELLTKSVSEGGLGYTYNPSTFTYVK